MPDHDIELISKALGELIEHFDSVQIFVTRHEPTENNGTIAVHKGQGNWFARYGQVKNWIIQEDEDAKLKVRGENE